MKRRILATLLLGIGLISVLLFFNFYQLSLIDSLQLRLEGANREINILKEENEKIGSQITAIDVSASILTRLGAKLFEGGVKDVRGTVSNYVWMTGEVQNEGNVSAFVSLSIKVSTTYGVEIQEIRLGTLQPDQSVPVASTVWPENGNIVSWTITPLGYYFP
jgi:hypothetical protein